MALGISQFCIALTVITTVSANKHNEPLDENMFSFQTGVDLGSSFAGGITYDKRNNRLFMTGGTYARGFFMPQSSGLDFRSEVNSDCFVVSVQLPGQDDGTAASVERPEWRQPTRLGYVKDPEACSTAHYIDDTDRIFLGASTSGESIGRTDVEGDVLPSLDQVSLFGEVISVSMDHLYNVAPVIPQHYLFGGRGFFQSEVNYPFAITSNPRASDYKPNEEPIYVASLYSKYGGVWAHEQKESGKEVDLTNPHVEGNVWGIAIQKIGIKHSNATDVFTLLDNPTHMEREWMVNFESSDFQKLQAVDMKYVNGHLLLAGSTYDFAEQFAGELRGNRDFQDYDGFLVKINPENGTIATPSDTRPNEKMKLRIQTEGESDDFIKGMCLHPADKDGFIPYAYVVGNTLAHIHDNRDHRHYSGEKTVDTADIDEESKTGNGFIMQIDLITMEAIWKNDVQGHEIEATDCAVTEDGGYVYVVGNAKNGAVIDPNWTTNGGDDVWVRKYRTDMAEIEWELQLGSSEDESMAQGGSIVLDREGNAIIYGNTRGEMGRTRVEGMKLADETNDLFVMTVTKDGAYLPPNSNPVFQIDQVFFASGATTHQIWISCMVVAAILLFFYVLGANSEWKEVDLWYYSYLSELFPSTKNNNMADYWEGTALTEDAVTKKSVPLDLSETEESHDDEDDIVFNRSATRSEEDGVFVL